MSKFFVMMSVVFLMAFGVVSNATAGEDFVGVFAHDITGGLVDKDFLKTDNVLGDEDIDIAGKSIAFPFVVAHDMVKGGSFAILGTIGGTAYGSALAADYVVDGSAVATGSAVDGFGVMADYVVGGVVAVTDYLGRILNSF